MPQTSLLMRLATRPRSAPHRSYRLRNNSLRQVKSGAQASHPSSIQHRIACGREQVSVWREAVDAFVERNGAATGHTAFGLAFRALVEIAQPSQISVGT